MISEDKLEKFVCGVSTWLSGELFDKDIDLETEYDQLNVSIGLHLKTVIYGDQIDEEFTLEDGRKVSFRVLFPDYKPPVDLPYVVKVDVEPLPPEPETDEWPEDYFEYEEDYYDD